MHPCGNRIVILQVREISYTSVKPDTWQIIVSNSCIVIGLRWVLFNLFNLFWQDITAACSFNHMQYFAVSKIQEKSSQLRHATINGNSLLLYHI